MDLIKLGGAEGTETYIDGAFFVSHQEVPEEPGLVHVPQPYHVIHTLHRGGVHGPHGALCLLAHLVLLYESYKKVYII